MESCESGATNPLIRVCHLCGSTDRGLNRACAAPKEKKGAAAASAEVSLSRKEALVTKDRVNNMEHADRVQWYRDEAVKRKSESRAAKRTWADSKGCVTQKSANGTILDDVVHYETFEDYAQRQIGLKRCEDEAGAVPLWKAACSSPGASVIQRNGLHIYSKLDIGHSIFSVLFFISTNIETHVLHICTV